MEAMTDISTALTSGSVEQCRRMPPSAAQCRPVPEGVMNSPVTKGRSMLRPAVRRDSLLLPALATGLVLTYLSAQVLVGADTMWMVALGEHVARARAVPDGLPFASADTSGWPNVPVLGELALFAAHSTGSLGLAVALLLADAVMLLALAASAQRRGAGPLATAFTVVVTAAGMLTVLGVVRAQLLSLVPFALLVVLLRAEEEEPSRRVWLCVPLIIVWANLHGAVLVGVALIGCYLVFSRVRRTPVEAVLVAVCCVLAVWLNPALVRTGTYYAGVLTNEAARSGSELWSRPDLRSPFDVLMVLSAFVLTVLAGRWGRLRLWEVVAVAGMVVATFSAARHGMWLLMFLLGPAALALSRATRQGPLKDMAVRMPSPRLVGAVGLVALAGLCAVTLTQREHVLRGPGEIARAVAAATQGKVVLAPEPLAEDLAAAGVTVWASNPIDAFSPADQRAYLAFIRGDGQAAGPALEDADVVVAPVASPSERVAIAGGFTERSRIRGYVLLSRGT